MKFKKIIPAIILIFALCCVNVYAKTMQFTMGDFNAKVDDGAITSHKMEVAPYTVSGRTLVPVRVVAETFGADVKWINEENKVVITMGDRVISMIIGQAVATVDGKNVTLDVAPVLKNGRTLVPLRFVSETLGFDVEYLPSTEQILITDDPAVYEFNGTKIYLTEYKALYKLNKLLFAQNGYNVTDRDVAAYTATQLMDYAVYDSEAKKWGFGVEPLLYSSIRTEAKNYTSYFDDVLDASWIALLEKDSVTTFLMNFLKLLYEPEASEVEEYRNTVIKDYVAAKHILVTDENLAKDILKQINNGADFDTLMNEYSEDPGLATAPGGYIFTDGQMVKEFEDATKALKIGQVSKIVKTEHGYHIIKRIEISDDYVKNAITNEKIVEHLDDVADKGTAKLDTYTVEQLIELCK